MVEHFDLMAKIKAGSPLASVSSGLAPQESREETVSSDAEKAADISGVLLSSVFGCKERVMMIYMDNDKVIDSYRQRF